MQMFTGEDPKPEEYTSLDAPPSEDLLDPKVQEGLEDVVKKFVLDDNETRKKLLRLYKLCDLYFKGIQTIFWSVFHNDWRTPYADKEVDPSAFKFNGYGFDKIINIFRSHGESIVAALSAGVPYVKFFPENADDPDDITTAHTFSKVSELVQDQNSAPLIFIKSLFILYNQAFVAAYNYSEADEKYGVFQEPVYTKVQKPVDKKLCPECGYDLTDESEFEAPGSQAPGLSQCSQCMETVSPIVTKQMVEVTELSGHEAINKARERIEVFGPLNVRIPVDAATQEECGFLMLEREFHYAKMRAKYPEYRTDINPGGSLEEYDRWARAAIDTNQENAGLVTERICWLRPWAYEILPDEVYQLVKAEYPKGCRVTFVNELIVEVSDEEMDRHWTISVNPMARSLHADPIGKPALPIQEWKNESTDLTAETIRYTIPQTFADASVLDFKQYRKAEIRPGVVFPVKPRTGMNADSAFFQTRTASLAPEVIDWIQRLETDGQFVTGDVPSLHGGQQEGGKTLGEYQESRSNALSRLSLIWKMLNEWWAQVMEKSVQDYINNLLEDEYFSKKQGSSFVNVWIRLSEVTGKVGRVSAETSEQFPISWAQKRGILMDLLGLQREQIDYAIFHPDNVETVAQIMGMDELSVPGESDRLAELYNISELIKTEPQIDPMTGQIGPSVQPIQDLDDDMIHIQTCKSWLLSEQGRDAQTNNPAGYANVMAHMKMHIYNVQMAQMAAPPEGAEGEGGSPSAGPSNDNGAVEPPPSGEPSPGEP
jgi:hypothetical protein